MIEIAAAFATAQAAVAGIKKAVQLGKDINGLIGEFSRFFDAKDAVQKAANDAGKSGKSDTAQALELVMQAEQLRQAEEELKHTLIYGYGAADLWEQMLMQRAKVRQERERREREERKQRLAARKRLIDFTIYGFVAFCVSIAFLGIVYIILQV
jgi:hypothetical protein